MSSRPPDDIVGVGEIVSVAGSTFHMVIELHSDLLTLTFVLWSIRATGTALPFRPGEMGV
jgi:hypothetical protein